MTADLFAGTFDTQPLVFAHLWDAADGAFNADGVEVICQTDPGPRLRHYFSEMDSRAIEDALGLQTTCVIIFAPSGLELSSTGTDKLRFLGSYPILRTPPGQT